MSGSKAPITAGTFYRADIDGLRAIAVLSVLAFHYGVALPGGFTGVDVFFVISGFLITSKLNDDIGAGMFSILGFYDRRIRRILPALFVMLAATLLAGYFLLMPGEYKSLAASAAMAAFGISNFYFLSNTGYFDQAAELLPQLHTWSLAVEEQFYVVWPPLLFAIAKGRSRFIVAAILSGIVLTGLAASLAWYDANPKSAFYMAAPRAWELVFGALLVFLQPLPRAFGEVAALIGLALIGAGFFLVSTASFPGVAALFPCIGAALVVWPRSAKTTIGSLLGLLSPIGLISYSLYLWHWPVWVLFRTYINGGIPTAQESARLAAISVALATLSYIFVEKPFRKLRWKPARSVSAGLAACLLILCGAMFVYMADGFPRRLSPASYAMRSLDVMWNWKCPATVDISGQRLCSFGAPWASAKYKALLWGDSHAEHFVPLLNEAGQETDTSFVILYGCAPFYGKDTGLIRDFPLVEGQKYFDWCSDKMTAAFNILDKHPEITIAALATPWTAIQPITLMQDGKPVSTQVIEHAIENIAGRIISSSRSVLILGDVPYRPTGVPVLCVSNHEQIFRRCGEAKGLSRKIYLDTIAGKTYAMLQRIAEKNPRVFVTFPGQSLCKAENCALYVNGEFLYKDIDHIRRNLSSETDRELADSFGITKVLKRINSLGEPLTSPIGSLPEPG